MEEGKAFSPAGISSFFEICNRSPNGTLIVNPERVGARGGGFVIDKGILTEVSAVRSERKRVEVFINGKVWPEAETTKTVVDMLLEKVEETYSVAVRHHVEVPIGAGFGSSAAGALGAALALSKALNINLTYNQMGRVAHVAEVMCRTGLGTVGPLMLGGCIVTVEPGAPGYALIDRIPISSDYRIVAGVFQPVPTKEVFDSPKKRKVINEWGRRTVDEIIADPSLENFMRASKKFAMETGFVSDQVRRLIQAAEEAGAVGVAQNMVGEAVHALVTIDKTESVVQSFKRLLPGETVLVAKIDHQGAQLLG